MKTGDRSQKTGGQAQHGVSALAIGAETEMARGQAVVADSAARGLEGNALGYQLVMLVSMWTSESVLW